MQNVDSVVLNMHYFITVAGGGAYIWWWCGVNREHRQRKEIERFYQLVESALPDSTIIVPMLYWYGGFIVKYLY